SMTGANRLLLGAGWPVVFFVSYLASRGKNPKAGSYLQLDRAQALEVLFLGISTLYSFLIVAKGTLDILDAAALISVFASYVYIAARIPPLAKERLEEMSGVALAIGRMRLSRRYGVILSFVAVGGLVTILGAQPFVGGLIEIGGALGISQYLLIQWLALFLVQFFIPPLRLEVSAVYLLLAAVELLLTRGRIVIFRQVGEILREYVHKRPQG